MISLGLSCVSLSQAWSHSPVVYSLNSLYSGTHEDQHMEETVIYLKNSRVGLGHWVKHSLMETKRKEEQKKEQKLNYE